MHRGRWLLLLMREGEGAGGRGAGRAGIERQAGNKQKRANGRGRGEGRGGVKETDGLPKKHKRTRGRRGSSWKCARAFLRKTSELTSVTQERKRETPQKQIEINEKLSPDSSPFILSRNSPRRSTPAENALRDSNWLTMSDRSPRMWLNAPYDWLTCAGVFERRTGGGKGVLDCCLP